MVKKIGKQIHIHVLVPGVALGIISASADGS
jgi:hypothetical protein